MVHIDLGVAFEQGRFLSTPEVVPFRLTRDIVDGMGATGISLHSRGGQVLFPHIACPNSFPHAGNAGKKPRRAWRGGHTGCDHDCRHADLVLLSYFMLWNLLANGGIHGHVRDLPASCVMSSQGIVVRCGGDNASVL